MYVDVYVIIIFSRFKNLRKMTGTARFRDEELKRKEGKFNTVRAKCLERDARRSDD